MENLGGMYAYVVNSWNYSLDSFQKLFLDSGTAEDFACGDIELICGMSGAELTNYVLWASNLPQRHLEAGNNFEILYDELLPVEDFDTWQFIQENK